jgi:hypothetical protein
MRGTFLKNRDIFTKLCGDDAMKHVILVTTKWAEVEPDKGAAREEQLKMKFWKETLDKGALTERFMCTHESAWNIVDKLVGRSVPKRELVDQPLRKGKPVDNRVLQIRKGVVDLRRSLSQTAAARTLSKLSGEAFILYA